MARLLPGVLLLTAFCWTDVRAKADVRAKECTWNCTLKEIDERVPIFRCLSKAIGPIKHDYYDTIPIILAKTIKPKWGTTHKISNFYLTGAPDVKLYGVRTTEDHKKQLVFIEMEMRWTSLKLVADFEIGYGPGSTPWNYESEMSFDPKWAAFQKSWLIDVSGRSGRTLLPHRSFHPKVTLYLEGDIVDVKLIHNVFNMPSDKTDDIKWAVYQNFNSSVSAIENFLKEKADSWFEDNVLPMCGADTLNESFYDGKEEIYPGQ